MLGEIEAAWDAVHEALPARWHVGPVTFDPGHHAWTMTAHGPHPGRGKAPQTVAGTGDDETAALGDLGRWLQELGDDPVEHEPVGSNGRKIDYRAGFVDGSVCVEAYSKRMNLHARAGVAYVDNSEERIRLAFRDWRKRQQAAGASDPAILAIDGGIFGAHDYDFDSALLGSSTQHMGFDRQVAGFSFNVTTGGMSTDAASPWAGVLAFLDAGVFSAREPILYLSPHFRGRLPIAFLGVQRRMLAATGFPGNDDQPMTRIRFGVPLFHGPE